MDRVRRQFRAYRRGVDERIETAHVEADARVAAARADADARVAAARADADARIAAVQKLLEDERRERQDLQLKLLRVGFNINPFYELLNQEQSQSSILPQAEQPQGIGFHVSPSMSHEEVRATYVAEAVEKYGGNMRMIQRHVERRLAEHYEHRAAPPSLVSAAEMQAAQQVAADLEAACEEGRAAVAKQG